MTIVLDYRTAQKGRRQRFRRWAIEIRVENHRHAFPVLLRDSWKMEGGDRMKKRAFRHDSRPYTPLRAGEYVTPAEAHQHLTGQQSGAEVARLRMLQRMGLDAESGSAEDARQRMIEKRERRER